MTMKSYFEKCPSMQSKENRSTEFYFMGCWTPVNGLKCRTLLVVQILHDLFILVEACDAVVIRFIMILITVITTISGTMIGDTT